MNSTGYAAAGSDSTDLVCCHQNENLDFGLRNVEDFHPPGTTVAAFLRVYFSSMLYIPIPATFCHRLCMFFSVWGGIGSLGTSPCVVSTILLVLRSKIVFLCWTLTSIWNLRFLRYLNCAYPGKFSGFFSFHLSP